MVGEEAKVLLMEIRLWLDGLPLQLLKMLKEGWAV